MLADEIMDSRDLAGLGAGLERLRSDIRSARRFLLDADFAVAADEVSDGNEEAIEKSERLFRIPFRTTWIEVAQAHRPRFVHGTTMPGTHEGIRRVGILMREEEDGTVGMHLAWSFRNGATSVSWMTAMLAPERSRAPARGPLAVLPRQGSLRERISVDLSSYHREAWKDVQRRPDALALGRRLQDGAKADWSGETRFWIAAVALLNSRNVALLHEVEGRRRPESRSRAGKAFKLDHVLCRIDPRIRARLAAASGEEGGPTRAHFVRGHFKARSTGLFWWSPYLRGDPSLGSVEKDYVVAGPRR